MGTKCNDCAIKNTVFSTHNLDHCIALRRPSLISNEAKRSCTYMRLLPKCTLKVQWLEHAKKEDQCRNFKLLGKVQRPKFNALKFYNQKFNLKSSMRWSFKMKVQCKTSTHWSFKMKVQCESSMHWSLRWKFNALKFSIEVLRSKFNALKFCIEVLRSKFNALKFCIEV